MWMSLVQIYLDAVTHQVITVKSLPMWPAIRSNLIEPNENSLHGLNS